MEDNVAVRTTFPKSLTCAPRTLQQELALIYEPKGPFVPIISDVFKMGSTTDSKKAETPTLLEFITTYQSTNLDCQDASLSDRKPISRISVDNKGFRALVSPLDSASRQGVTATLHTRFPHHFYYFLSADHLKERCTYVSMTKELHWLQKANHAYSTVEIAPHVPITDRKENRNTALTVFRNEPL